MNYSPHLNVMLKAARKSAKGLLRDFGELTHLQVSEKGANDFVSTADYRSEKIIIEELERARPDYSILSEEIGEINRDSEYRWIIDPLDGTVNFLHALPLFCISIALEKRISKDKTEIIAAVIEAPMLGETYIAERGGGAWIENNGVGLINKQRLRVSARNNINHALIAGGFNYDNEQDLKLVQNLATKNISLRVIGSTALSLAYLSSGRCDVFIKRHEKYWDIAAGMLLVREAGGIVSDINGKTHTSTEDGIIASNNNLYKDFMKFFN